jgi:D-serine deaminase-like pyridoxal phosphate-dependent protein
MVAFPGAGDLETPVVVVDRARLEANIARLSRLPAGVQAMPHAKTHKTLEIARMQAQAGASGVTVAKPGEALVYLEGGVKRVNLAFPLIDPAKITQLLWAAASAGAEMRCTADSQDGVAALADAAQATGFTVPVWLEIDPGLGRCGVDPASEALFALARQIVEAPGLLLLGLFSHAGHAYGCEGVAAIAAVARAERDLLRQTRERLAADGIAAPGLSVGATPTFLAAGIPDGVQEMRPGNYVFLDLTAVRLGLVPREALALAVIATVVSANDRHAIIDAGSKVLSSDQRPHAATSGGGYGEAVPLDDPGAPPFSVARLSEEHGWVALEGRKLKIGTKVLVLPNHSCVVANLADDLVVLAESEAPQRFIVAARGRVR